MEAEFYRAAHSIVWSFASRKPGQLMLSMRHLMVGKALVSAFDQQQFALLSPKDGSR